MLGVFGKFTLLDKIADGGMAEVFRASVKDQVGQDRIVAIKRLHRSLCDDSELIDMLTDEARLTVQLDHPGIGRVFDLEEYDDQSFLIMEFIDGPDLQFLVEQFAFRGELFPINAALWTMCEALDALHYAHTKSDPTGSPMNIVHRDVSPQNIMIDVNGKVRIVDFGIAKAKDRLVQTQYGIIKGKYFYMSPEQAMGHHVDGRADVFSAGMVLYELLAGRSPYQDLPDVELLKTVRRADFPPISHYRPELDPELVNILSRATLRDPDRRFASAQEFQRALLSILGNYPPIDRQNLSQLVQEFVQPTLDPAPLMNRELYSSSNESVIFRLSESDCSRIPVEALTELYDRPEALKNYQLPLVEPMERKPPVPQKTQKKSKGMSRQHQKIAVIGIFILAGFFILIAILVIFMKRGRESEAVLPEVAEIEKGEEKVGEIEKGEEKVGEENTEKNTGEEKRIKKGIAFHSEPSNAIVVVNGKELGTTPVSLSLIIGKKYKIEFRKKGFVTTEHDFLPTDKNMELQVKLEEFRRIVSILSYPSNAIITVKGKNVGKTPLTLSGFSDSNSLLLTARIGSKKLEKVVKWKEDETAIKEVMFEFKSGKKAYQGPVDLVPVEQKKKKKPGLRKRKSRRKKTKKSRGKSDEFDVWSRPTKKKKNTGDGW